MPSLLKKASALFLFWALLFSAAEDSRARSEIDEESDTLNYLLHLVKNAPPASYNTEDIYLKGDVLFCTGTLKAAVENNRAAELMIKADYKSAIPILEQAIKHSSLFFPFRYNLGLCYMHLNQLDSAMLHFQKAVAVVPEYSRTYLQIGFIHQLRHRDTEAIAAFREGIRRNPKELETFIRIGDIFFNRHQVEMAKKYYEAALKIDHRYPNGLLGRAKIYFNEGRYIHAINLLKAIDIKREYDKSYHYYYAEAAFKLRDYTAAADQYRLLLSFRNDRFFITNSTVLIEHKLNMSDRLSGR